MLASIDRSTEARLIAGIDPAALEVHLDAFEGLERFPGSEDEWEACEYVVETLDGFGLEAEVLEYTGYVSLPELGKVEVTTPHPRVIDEAITTSFGGTTPPTGLNARLEYVDSLDDSATTTGDLAGAIAVTSGLPRPESVIAAERAGAVGVVFGSVTEGHLHEMIVTPVWGTPSTDDVDTIPDIPVVQIDRTEAARLRETIEAGPCEATLTTAVTTELRRLPCPVGRLRGTASDRYMVIGNHVDSWYEGMTDNATAMASTLEIARIFADRPPHRGIVFGFWSAHSFGRFAGSAWYADTHWNDLRDNAVAYLHLDLNGLKGADRLWYQHMAELEDEQIDVLETHSRVPVDTDAGHEAEGAAQWEAEDRPGRAADQSFWGAGLSSVFCGLRLESGTPTGGPIGGGWWWHTAEDTRDKVDTDVLVEETGLYVALVSRICGSAILPHDFSSTVRDFESTIDEIESVARGEAAFDELRGALDELGRNLEIATDLLVEEARRSTGVFRPGEDLQVRLGNLLIPALYMDRQDTEHEPALPHRLLPCLRPAEALPDLSGPQRRFAEVGLTRSRAKLLHRLSRANEAVEGFIRSHQDQ